MLYTYHWLEGSCFGDTMASWNSLRWKWVSYGPPIYCTSWANSTASYRCLLCPLIVTQLWFAVTTLQEGRVQNEKHGLARRFHTAVEWTNTGLKWSASACMFACRYPRGLIFTSPQSLKLMHAQVSEVVWYLFVYNLCSSPICLKSTLETYNTRVWVGYK